MSDAESYKAGGGSGASAASRSGAVALSSSPTVVIVEDDRLSRNGLVAMLNRQGFAVESCDDGREVVDRVARGGVDLVIMDVVMPRMGGLEACRLLKGMIGDGFLPVLLVTSKADVRSRVEGLRIGADDYLCKPFDEQELLARVEALLRIKRLHDQVTRDRNRLEDLTIHDQLTGLYSYRFLQKRLNEEFKRAERYHDPLACILVDVDRLAALNELGGRELGDGVLKGVASIIRNSVREIDVGFRFGDDEFLVLLPSTHFAGSVTVAERIWRGVHERPFLSDLSRRMALGVSIGVSLYPSRDVRKKDELIRSADRALYRAKSDGGNRICVYQQEGLVHTPVAGTPINYATEERSLSDRVRSMSSSGATTSGGATGASGSSSGNWISSASLNSSSVSDLESSALQRSNGIQGNAFPAHGSGGHGLAGAASGIAAPSGSAASGATVPSPNGASANRGSGSLHNPSYGFSAHGAALGGAPGAAESGSNQGASVLSSISTSLKPSKRSDERGQPDERSQPDERGRRGPAASDSSAQGSSLPKAGGPTRSAVTENGGSGGTQTRRGPG